MRAKISIFVGIVFVLFNWVYVYADTVVRVVSVKDGDSLIVLEGKKQLEVRLECIDAPEIGQPYGNTAKDALSKLVFDKFVTIEKRGTDKYGRSLAYVYTADGVNVNEQMVDRGYAWHFDKYCSSAKLKDLQKYAKQDRKGLWADNNPTPPWEFRQTKPQAQTGGRPTFSNEDLERYSKRPAATEQKPASQSAVSSKGAYVGSANADVYHSPSCEWAQRISSQNLVNFESVEDAKRRGYRACKVCRPPSY